MLEIENLHVKAGGREILKGIDLKVPDGQTCILFGPNGSGKSTLLSAIMGYGTTSVTEGKIVFKGVDITDKTVDERARLGIGMMMQRPPNITGVKLGDLVKASAKYGYNDDVVKNISDFKLDKFMERDINVGFSGGEIKRSEIMQLTVQRPDLVLLDEPESGVDLENIDLIGEKVRDLLYHGAAEKGNRKDRSALVITHTGQILNYIGADLAYIMRDGVIWCSGEPMDIFNDIREKGYGECIACRTKK
ncbi:MAG: ABC transporter ATP-binding protein [Candidatus Methanomethylophilaceae archaeon]|nr:ABC transporter ATP-binding protein [Candidatus Methanomethylophilaceae archaeon]